MHPELLSLSLFMLGTSCSPGPNNIVASYSGFNFGVIKTFPHMLGVIFGFTTVVCVLNFGLINIFKIYPLIQEILKISGSIFLVYLAYKIAFSKNVKENKKENPVKFIETFFFQFLNPKGVIVAIIIVSTYVESGNNFINYSFWVILVSFLCALISITFWTFVGKFFRRFATNEKLSRYLIMLCRLSYWLVLQHFICNFDS